MKYIFGLGNPGKKYRNTRHNAGFEVVDILAARFGICLRQKPKLEIAMGDGSIDGVRAALCEPQTYMNQSGYAVSAVLDYFDADTDDLIVVYDDIDLPFGTIRIREKGSAGTHNGMRSVIQYIKSKDFVRVRIGIGKPGGSTPLQAYVLGKFDDPAEAHKIMERGADAVQTLLVSGIAAAQQLFRGSAAEAEPDGSGEKHSE